MARLRKEIVGGGEEKATKVRPRDASEKRKRSTAPGKRGGIPQSLRENRTSPGMSIGNAATISAANSGGRAGWKRIRSVFDGIVPGHPPVTMHSDTSPKTLSGLVLWRKTTGGMSRVMSDAKISRIQMYRTVVGPRGEPLLAQWIACRNGPIRFSVASGKSIVLRLEPAPRSAPGLKPSTTP